MDQQLHRPSNSLMDEILRLAAEGLTMGMMPWIYRLDISAVSSDFAISSRFS